MTRVSTASTAWVGRSLCATFWATVGVLLVLLPASPAEAQCDGPQALLPDMFRDLMTQLRQIAAVWKREFADIAEPVNA